MAMIFEKKNEILISEPYVFYILYCIKFSTMFVLFTLVF